jgi:hypothetical protein
MSSLAFDDLQEQIQGLDNTLNFTPDLQIVKPRHSSRNQTLSQSYAADEVVYVGGRFTVSF